jgi:hypothetical protein
LWPAYHPEGLSLLRLVISHEPLSRTFYWKVLEISYAATKPTILLSSSHGPLWNREKEKEKRRRRNEEEGKKRRKE